MKNILITGASSGIGLEIAQSLHTHGYKVFGTSRHPEKHSLEFPFELLPLDITDEKSIEECLRLLMSKARTLDVLINNAGGFLGGSAEETSMEMAYRQFETNFWGTIRMTKAVLPLMRKQGHGKIITTGSLVGLIGIPFSSFYSASKHAVEGFFKSLRMEVKRFNIHVSVLEPGFFRTNIDEVADRAPESIEAYRDAGKKLNEFFKKSISYAPTPGPVADTVLKIIETESPKYSYPIGKNTRLFPLLQFLRPAAFEDRFLKRLRLN